LFFELSAKNDTNIQAMFDNIITFIPLNNTMMTTHEITSTCQFGANNSLFDIFFVFGRIFDLNEIFIYK